ncbi:MAG: hypothetical protein A2017_20055 [Lentisphaerae bacterium GWF2_44_16]|nr:MAG: hypothetical protein A2017_20055 [Lentisphaerae bacterium GWF2_44_16]
MINFWQQEPKELASQFKVDLNTGLNTQEASERLKEYGNNQLTEKEASSPWKILLDQFKDLIIWILIGASIISGCVGEWVDSLAIIAIVIINAILGFIQEYRAEKSMAALRKLSSPSTKTIRNGNITSVPSAELVPGDIVELESGDNIPADCRIISHTANFSVQEASLTGESTPVAKSEKAIAEKDVQLADRKNMAFMGTSVVSGRGRAMIVLTGMKTQLGHIAGMIQDIEKEETPLQKKLDEFGKLIVKICFVLVIIVFALQLLRGGTLIEVFITSISLAVAAIPEGLPAVVTIALALGVHRMVKRHVLIRKLPSVETLGCATVICSDKTGTLTKNEMTVQGIYADGKLFRVTGIGSDVSGEFQLEGQNVKIEESAALHKTLLCGVLCNGANINREDGSSSFKMFGDPTESSILVCAAKGGILKGDAEKINIYIEELPFDSDRKKMSVIRKDQSGEIVAWVKGAPDLMLKDCVSIESDGKSRPLTDADRDEINKVNATLANEAMRILAVAYRKFESIPEKFETSEIENNLTFLGLIAMIDPPREEAKEAIKKCDSAGIKAVMITGDHRNTAVAIARQLGLYKQNSKSLTGEELESISDIELEKEVENIPVYARVSPEHKLRIVKAWRKKGHIVAMTGDGVNDAPAIKEADIGVAMGITGTDVTKEVSDMIVTDDNFASIVSAVEEGRGIYDNILKFVRFLLSCNAGEILVMLIASIAGMPIPLLPIHILWVNLVTDGLPALALGVDPVGKDIMKRHPRSPNEAVVTKMSGLIMIAQGLFIAACTLGAFMFVRYYHNESVEQARTAAFMVLSCSQLVHAFNCRSNIESIFTIGFFTNMKLIYAVIVSLFLQIVITELPFTKEVFKVEDLNFPDWAFIAAMSLFPLIAMEIFKLILRRIRA